MDCSSADGVAVAEVPEGYESLILKVPSATIYGEFNYLLNPTHPDMSTLKIGPILPFAFDPRIVE